MGRQPQPVLRCMRELSFCTRGGWLIDSDSCSSSSPPPPGNDLSGATDSHSRCTRELPFSRSLSSFLPLPHPTPTSRYPPPPAKGNDLGRLSQPVHRRAHLLHVPFPHFSPSLPEVRGVRLRRDRIVVVLEHKVYVYNFADLKLLQQVETLSNPKGLCEVSQSPNSFVMACPGKHRQQIRIELFDQRRTHFIAAHDSEPACIALSLDGQRLATASSKGTLIRVFNTADGTKLHELRRGVERADIYSLVFSPKAPFLVAASDRGTIHVFSLRHSQGQGQGQEDGVGGGEGKAGATGSGGGAVSALSSFGLMKGGLLGVET
ncbi:unnamed protein product [Closterium sp. NIES-54]